MKEPTDRSGAALSLPYPGEWNDTQAPFAEDANLYGLFAGRVAETPTATALICGQERLSFAELGRRVDQLAAHLIDQGVGPGALVAVLLERRPTLVVALLAVLRIGAAYVPLDPLYPRGRLRFVVDDAKVTAVLTQRSLAGKLDAGAKLLLLETLAAAPVPAANIDIDIDARDRAYVIYTSGSTGTPKGVAIEHRSVVALLHWAKTLLTPAQRRCTLASTSIAFDIAGLELWLPLCHGGCVVLADNLLSLPTLPAAAELTWLQAVPSAMAELLDDHQIPPGVEVIFIGGEAFPGGLVQRIADRCSGARVFNVYGPTETTIWSTFAEVDLGDRWAPAIGRPITNTRVHVLDERLSPVAIGEPGELYIAGAGLARGYLGRPELDAERFIVVPASSLPGEVGETLRMYKTGDIVRWREDGQLEFLGRADQQVKLKGHRIELEEIAARLGELGPITQASVVVSEDPPQLVAYLQLDPQAAIPKPAWALHMLADGLPLATVTAAEANHLHELIFRRGIYTRWGAPLADGACILDVGGNIGLFAIHAHLLCRQPRIISFEPVPAIADVLATNMAICGLDVTVARYGLSDAAKQVRFTYYPRWSALSGAYGDRNEEMALSRAFLRNQDRVLGEHADELVADRFDGVPVDCELRTLSSVIDEHDLARVDLLKINVEKSELDVLRGIRPEHWSRIEQCVIEVHDSDGRIAAVSELLQAQGFAVRLAQDPLMHDTGLTMVFARRDVQDAGAFVERPAAELSAELSAEHRDQRLPGLRRQLVSVPWLRAQLREQLPEVMIPEHFVALEALPRTLNGKIDRQALPALSEVEVGHKPEVAFVAPGDALEAMIAEIWAGLLGVERVGVLDNFFDIGGTSMQATQGYQQLVERSGLSFPLTDVLRYPSVRSLARHLGAEPEAGPAPAVTRGDARGASRRARRPLPHK